MALGRPTAAANSHSVSRFISRFPPVRVDLWSLTARALSTSHRCPGAPRTAAPGGGFPTSRIRSTASRTPCVRTGTAAGPPAPENPRPGAPPPNRSRPQSARPPRRRRQGTRPRRPVSRAARTSSTRARRTASTGREWTKFLPREKQAYVAGFLAGGAVADAQAAGAADSTAVHQAVDSLVRSGRLRFPFGHMVYVTQLDEFYWWQNHLPVPLYAALRDIDGRLKGHEQ